MFFLLDFVVKFEINFYDIIDINKGWINIKILFIMNKVYFLIK